MKEFFKSIGFRILAGLALLLVGVMIYAASTGGLATVPATLGGLIVTPVQSAFTWVSDGIGAIGNTVGGAFSSEKDEQIAALQEEVNALRRQLAEYESAVAQNAWYAEILGLHEQHTDYTFASGKVIAVDPTDICGNFTINAGSLAGVKPDDAVITAEGLVGAVSEVGLTYAKVRTVLDPDTKVSVLLSRSDETAYTGGTPALAQDGRFKLFYLERTSGAAAGDLVVTSGIGGVFPAGLPVGRITEVFPDSDGMTLTATVEPFAPLSSLKNVMVITSFEGQGEVVP